MRPPLLLLATLVATLTASAQVPSYVPTDGLVGWFPMDGNITNEVNGASASAIGTTAEPDRNGQAAASLGFNGAAYGVLNNANMPTGEFTISTWVKQSQSWSTGAGIEFICLGSSANTSWGTVAGPEFIHLNRGRGCSGNGQVLSGVNFPLNEWVHLTYVCAGPGAATEVYLNGAFVGQSLNTTSGSCGSSNLYFGVDIFSAPEYITGGMDDIGIWNRALSDEEVLALYTAAPPILGCTDPDACNLDPTANSDDGSCEYGCQYCGPGTVWDPILQFCIAEVPEAAAAEDCSLFTLQELSTGYLNQQQQMDALDTLVVTQQAAIDSLNALLNNCPGND